MVIHIRKGICHIYNHTHIRAEDDIHIYTHTRLVQYTHENKKLDTRHVYKMEIKPIHTPINLRMRPVYTHIRVWGRDLYIHV